MSKCCIQGCESFKYEGTDELAYFNFPLHDEALLKKWLNQMKLPNWKPKYQQICSLHFAEEDIDRRPNRRQPYLKLESVPTIFPKLEKKVVSNAVHYIVLADPIPLQSAVPTFNVGLNGIPAAPMLQQNSFFLIPAEYSVPYPSQITAPLQFNDTAHIRDQLQQIIRIPNPSYAKINNLPMINESKPTTTPTTTTTSTTTTNSPPKLRKILPKSSSTHSTIDSLPISPPEDICKPDILIVPKARGINSSKELHARTKYSGDKVPTLMITINKLCDDVADCKRETTSENASAKIDIVDLTKQEDSSMDEDKGDKEITIENSLANRSVTFKLDPRTGEIIVESQTIDVTSMDGGRTNTTKTKRKVDTGFQPTDEKLNEARERGQRNCAKLRKKMRPSRQCHKREEEQLKEEEEEEEEMQQLQDHPHDVEDVTVKNVKREVTTISSITRNNVTTNESEKFIVNKRENSIDGTMRDNCARRIMEDSSITGNNNHQSRLSSLSKKHNNGETKLRMNEAPKKMQFETQISDKIKDKRNNKIISFHDSESDDITYQEEFLD